MKKKEEVIRRRCLVCGKHMRINLWKNGKYDEGHYFGKVEVPVGKGEYRKVGARKLGENEIGIVKWSGKKAKIEYWECNDCFKEAGFECWLEERIEKIFGEKCKKREQGCPACEAWKVHDMIIRHNRGKL